LALRRRIHQWSRALVCLVRCLCLHCGPLEVPGLQPAGKQQEYDCT
jgi:hypothetical protein